MAIFNNAIQYQSCGQTCGRDKTFHFCFISTVNTVLLNAFRHTIFLAHLSFSEYPATNIST